jgi:hypothetical protein
MMVTVGMKPLINSPKRVKTEREGRMDGAQLITLFNATTPTQIAVRIAV